MKLKVVRCINPNIGLIVGKEYEVTRNGCCYEGYTYLINRQQYLQSWFEEVKLEEVICETKNSK